MGFADGWERQLDGVVYDEPGHFAQMKMLRKWTPEFYAVYVYMTEGIQTNSIFASHIVYTKNILTLTDLHKDDDMQTVFVF